MPTPRSLHRTAASACLLWTIVAAGCDGRSTTGRGASPEPPPLGREDQAIYQQLETKIDKVINDHLIKYGELRYEYNEGLLAILDQIELTLSGKLAGNPPRFLSKLDPRDEHEHFRESVGRWEAKTGKSLRAEVDALKAEVAARPAGQSFHPEFQRKFSRAFDEFIPIEVAELHERRNRAIHADAEAILAPYRAEHPEPVRRVERLLSKPPYNLPGAAGPSPAGHRR